MTVSQRVDGADALKLLVARALRNFAYGYVGVIFALYLDLLGFDAARVGLIVTATAAGSAGLTIVWALVADRFGRRRFAVILSLLMACGGVVFAITADPLALTIAALFGSISTAGTDAAIFLTVDQAMLPQVAGRSHRTWVFAFQNFVGTLAVAVGSLAAGLVAVFSAAGLAGVDAYRPLFLLFAATGLASAILFQSVSGAVEAADGQSTRAPLGLGPSRRTVAKLVALYAIDSLGGGFVVQSIIAYWFYLAWHLDASALAVIFFATNILSAISMLAASPLARRFGLMNTMLISHVPFNVLTVLLPLAPTLWLAVAICLARAAVGQAFLPTRLSYVVSIVEPWERSAAAAYTNVSRAITSSITPAIAGIVMATGVIGLPFVLGGSLKLLFDALLFGTLRQVPPREEVESAAP